MRSRAVFLPLACCFSTARADPAWTASSLRRCRSASRPAVVCRSAAAAAASVSVVGAASAMAGSLALSMCENPWTYGPCGRRCSRPAAPGAASTATRRSTPPTWRRRGDRSRGASWSADHQSAGRGRMARHWEAPAGASVAVSVVVPMAGADRGWLPLLTGMAMARALQRVAGVPARLKWPNDVLVDGGKICGVLCEMVTPAAAGPAIAAGRRSPAARSTPAAWSSPARAPTWTSAARSCRWTRRRPCGCAG